MSFLVRLCQQLQALDVHYAVAGGYAVALHGAVRGTVDIDFVLDWNRDNVRKAEQSLRLLGLRPLHPLTADEVFFNRDALVKDKNLIAWSFYNPQNPVEVADIIITTDLVGKQPVTFMIQQQVVRVLGKADLIAMKKAAGRPQDIEDIKALEQSPDES